ncbi:hypothetical protein CCP3SC15_360032 [Gammaproteobacteria bacterium]
MITRRITNIGDPLVDGVGRPAAMVKISFLLIDDTGQPSDGWDVSAGDRVTPGPVEILTDASGIFSVDLWPTSRGDRALFWKCSVGINGVADFQNGLVEGSDLAWIDFRFGGVTPTPAEYLAWALVTGGVATKAILDAALGAYDEGSVVIVTNDPTAENNGTWRKEGAAWVKAAAPLVNPLRSVAKRSIISRSVVPERTTFFSFVGKNLANTNDPDVVLGGYYGEDDIFVTAAGYNQTGFVPVTAGTDYVTGQTGVFVVWYNADCVLIGSTNSTAHASAGHVTAPTGAYFGRFISTTGLWSTFQVQAGVTLDPYFRPSVFKIPGSNISDLAKSKLSGFTVYEDELAFSVTGKNLVNTSDINVILGGYRDGGDVAAVSPTVNTTGFVRVTPGADYTASIKTNFVNWYDLNKVIISQTLGATFTADGHVTAPAGAAFARFISSTAAWGTTFQVEAGTTSTAFERYDCKIPGSALSIQKNDVVDFSVDIEEATFATQGKNLSNPSSPDVVLGGYYDETNAPVVNATYNQTGFIRVIPGGDYTASYKVAFVLWFDNKKTFIGSTSSTTFNSDGYVTAPSYARFARFICTVAAWGSHQVEAGTASTAFVAYTPPVIGPQYLAGVAASTLTGKHFTSYGDSVTAQESWQPAVIADIGMSHTNLGIGSTTLAYVPAWEATYPSFVNATRLAALEASNPDIITILGGANDLARSVPIGTSAEFSAALGSKNKETFLGAYSFLIETLLTWKPTLEIILMTMYKSGYNTYPTYVQATLDVADFYALPCINLNNESGFSPFNIATYTTDNLHPNAAGGKRIATLVIDKMRSRSRV